MDVEVTIGNYFPEVGKYCPTPKSPITSINYLFCYISNNQKIRHTVNNFTSQVIMTSLCVS